jgi:hypothetical protein
MLAASFGSPDPVRRALLLILVLGASAPSTGCGEPDDDEDTVSGADPSDLQPYANEKFDGPLETFAKDALFEDAMFENVDAATAQGVQDLLEVSPYGTRSFLADERIAGVPFSEVLFEVAQSRRINPILLLTRLQVEKSLVSKTKRPSGSAVDFALGCGCADGRSCNEAYRGLDKQLVCGADTLREHYDASVAGTGQWAKGKNGTTLDPHTVQPRTHATASLYAYTPWVLEGRGGNWLVWNVSRKYIGTMLDRGTWNSGPSTPEPDPMEVPGSCEDHCGSGTAVPQGNGQSCFCDDECGGNGDCCDDFAEVCGGDPTDGDDPSGGSEDSGGSEESGGDQGGSCAGACGDQTPIEGADGSTCYCDSTCELSGDCCGDYEDECEMPAGETCAGVCDSADPQDAGDGTSCYCDALCVDNGDCCGDYGVVCG